jgi:hypothetical protein
MDSAQLCLPAAYFFFAADFAFFGFFEAVFLFDFDDLVAIGMLFS